MQRLRCNVIVGSLTTNVASAGCLDAAHTPLGETSGGDGFDNGGIHHQSMDSGYGLTVERVDETTIAKRHDAAALENQPPSVRNAVQAAAVDRYETDSVEDPVAVFIAEYEFVLDTNEAYYAFEAMVPQEVLTVTPIESNGIDKGAITGGETIWADPTTASAVLTAISHGEARRPIFPAVLHDLIVEYKYVTPSNSDDSEADLSEWMLAIDDRGGPPFWLEATGVDRTAVFGDRIANFELLSAAPEEGIKTVREEGRITLDDPPPCPTKNTSRTSASTTRSPQSEWMLPTDQPPRDGPQFGHRSPPVVPSTPTRHPPGLPTPIRRRQSDQPPRELALPQ